MTRVLFWNSFCNSVYCFSTVFTNSVYSFTNERSAFLPRNLPCLLFESSCARLKLSQRKCGSSRLLVCGISVGHLPETRKHLTWYDSPVCGLNFDVPSLLHALVASICALAAAKPGCSTCKIWSSIMCVWLLCEVVVARETPTDSVMTCCASCICCATAVMTAVSDCKIERFTSAQFS